MLNCYGEKHDLVYVYGMFLALSVRVLENRHLKAIIMSLGCLLVHVKIITG